MSFDKYKSFRIKNQETELDDIKYPKFKEMLDKHFPDAIPLSKYVSHVKKELENHGFKRENSIPCVCTCRDEISAPILNEFNKNYDVQSFVLCSLGGMMSSGTTALKAAYSHAPEDLQGHEHYIFIGMPHIAISEKGEIGVCYRKGKGHSHACGALIAFETELKKRDKETIDYKNKELDLYDLELSLLKKRLFEKVEKTQEWKDGKVPSLVQITKLTESQIFDDLEILVKKTIVDTKREYYAVISAIQIHGPDNETWIWPHLNPDFVVINGKKEILNF